MVNQIDTKEYQAWKQSYLEGQVQLTLNFSN